MKIRRIEKLNITCSIDEAPKVMQSFIERGYSIISAGGVYYKRRHWPNRFRIIAERKL